MSDLQIMFDETYDAPVKETDARLKAIADYYKMSQSDVLEAFIQYIHSDSFKTGRA
jgi:hypothetical protein